MKDINLKTEKSKDLKQKKLLTQQLEDENRKMESRLQELRMAMTKEKEERSCSGGYWNKGKPGALLTYKPEEKISVEKNSSRMKKITMLKDEQHVIPKRPAIPGTMAYIAQQKDIKLPKAHASSKKMSFKCGQCEEKQASVMCQECGEDYCAKCFASFHLRGALKKHRSIPISGMASFRRSSLTDAINDTTVSTPSTLKGDSYRDDQFPITDSSGKKTIEQGIQEDNESLKHRDKVSLNGNYDEQEQARQFQKAVQEWRNIGKPVMSTVNEGGEYSADCSTSMESTGDLPAPNSENMLASAIKQIQFKHSLSYAEQLMLKKYHREEQLAAGTSSEVPMFNSLNEFTPRAGMDSNNHNSSGWINGKLGDNETTAFNENMSHREDYVKIEEVSSELNISRSKKSKPVKITNDKPKESMRKSPEPSELVDASEITPRPQSSRLPNTPRFKTGLEYERPVSRARTRLDFQSQKGHLTGKPSLALSEIAALSRVIPDSDSVGESWLTLGVDNTSQSFVERDVSQNEKRPSSARSSSSAVSRQKLSYKFYQIGPKSWKPDRSLIPDNFEPRLIPEAWGLTNFKNELVDSFAPLSNSEALEEIHRISSMTTPRLDSSHIIQYATPRRLRSAHGRPLPAKKTKSPFISNRPHSARELSSYTGIVVEGDDMTRFDSHHHGELDEDRANAIQLFKELTSENIDKNQNAMSLNLIDSLDLDENDSDDNETVKGSNESLKDFNPSQDDELDELDTARHHDKEDVESLR